MSMPRIAGPGRSYVGDVPPRAAELATDIDGSPLELSAWTSGLWHGETSPIPPARPAPSAGRAQTVRLSRPIQGPRRLVLPQRTELQPGVIAHLTADGKKVYSKELSRVEAADILRCHPMREFSRRHGQLHKPGARWTHTTGTLIAVESQNEGHFVRLADYHPDIAHIAAQPMTLEWPDRVPLLGGRWMQTHTPDFALLSPGRAPLVVDVRRPERAAEQADIVRHAVIRETFAAAGIFYLVWTGMPGAALRNLAAFSGARVSPTSFERWGPRAVASVGEGCTVNSVAIALNEAGYDRLLALTLVKALLWRRHLLTDMSRPLTPRSPLWLPRNSGCVGVNEMTPS